MTDIKLHKLKYPIGKFTKPDRINETLIEEWIENIEQFPKSIQELTSQLSEEQKNWRYRPEGWSIKQIVHHCADSHMNSLIRFKLSLTENSPIIKPYFEDRWAELPDSKDNNLDVPITILIGLHAKWLMLLKSLNSEQLKRDFIHPENGKKFTLEETIGVYSWHCKHHLAHVKQALTAKGKYI